MFIGDEHGNSDHNRKTIRSCIEELIAEGKVRYAAENKQDSNNVLVKNNS